MWYVPGGACDACFGPERRSCEGMAEKSKAPASQRREGLSRGCTSDGNRSAQWADR